MAHTTRIPIAFEFRPTRAFWHSMAAEITGWASPKSPSAEICFLAKVHEGAKTYLLEIPWWALPKQVLTLYSKKLGDRPDVRGYSADLLVCSPSPGRETNKKLEADPWIMREEFLRLKQNTKALVAFLNEWGVWGTTRSLSGFREKLPASPRPRRTRASLSFPTLDPEKLPNIFALGAEDSSAGNYLLPSDLWEFQRQCRDGLKSAAHKWLAEAQKLLALIPRREYPHLFSVAGNCQEAIRTTITLDLLSKVKFRICARPDCGSPFPIRNRHRREYCCQYCAHIESVRRQRRATKQQAKHLSKGATHANRQGAR